LAYPLLSLWLLILQSLLLGLLLLLLLLLVSAVCYNHIFEILLVRIEDWQSSPCITLLPLLLLLLLLLLMFVVCCSRIFEILPVRIKDWQSSPCIADERNRAALERIRHQQLLAREKLLALDRRRRDLDAMIDRAKHLTVQPEADVSSSSRSNTSCSSISSSRQWLL